MTTPTTAMIEAFHEGGWPMFPILILGVLLVIAAVRYMEGAPKRPWWRR